jgi:hypothetical protein
MAITTIGGIVAGDSSKEDGGIVKASFNTSVTNIKFPVPAFAAGRYLLTFIGIGEPAASTYSGQTITGLPAVYKGDLDTKSDTGVIVFDLSTSQDGLIIENFEGAVALKTWDQTAQPATISKPGDTWTIPENGLHPVWNANDYKVTSPYYENGILMIGEAHIGDNAVFISEDDGETFKRIRIPTNHTFPNHGGFLYDSNNDEWWISPRGVNYWYKTSHANLTTAPSDRVPWERIHKMRTSETYPFPTRVLGGIPDQFWLDGENKPYDGGDDYDQIYRITNDIWLSNLNGQDILRTGDGGVTWQEFRITASPVAPMTDQPSGHFDFGVFNGSELVQAVRENSNGHVVRITNFLSSAGPTIQSMDIQNSTIYDVDFNNQWTTFTTSRGLYKLQNSTTTLTELTAVYGTSRRWRVAWTGAKWLFFDENQRADFRRVHNIDPFFTTAYNPELQADGLQTCQMHAYTNLNDHVDRGDADTHITLTADGINRFDVPNNYKPWSAITFTKQAGGKRTIFFPSNGEWYDNVYDQVFGHLITDDDGDTYDYKMATYGRYSGTLYSYGIGGTNNQIHWANASKAANVDGAGGFSFDGGKTWMSFAQWLAYQGFTNPNTQWDYWWFKADYRANSGGGHHYGFHADKNGNILMSNYISGEWSIFESRDEGVTWKHWRSDDGFTENGGTGQYQDLNFSWSNAFIGDDGTRWVTDNNTMHRWKNADFSDLVSMQSDDTPDGNSRWPDTSTIYGGSWKYANDRLIGIGHSSERLVTVDINSSDRMPRSRYMSIYEPQNTSLAYGNGIWLGCGNYDPSSADYRNSDDAYISYDNGDTWIPATSPMRTRSSANQTSASRGVLVFVNGYFILWGYGWQQLHRTKDGYNWEVLRTPIQDNWKVAEDQWNNDPEWKADPVWRNVEEGFIFTYENKLYMVSPEGEMYVSSDLAELTA